MDLSYSALTTATHAGESNIHSGFDPLSASSGNVQSFGRGSHEGVENQRPLPELNVGLSMTRELQFPSPLIKLGSNDTPSFSFDRKPKRDALRAHRAKPLTNADRPYLTHPKYLEYRSRPRQDIGPDGKPIWPDRIEAAFQNALVHIKPMGRKKCSQRGRPYGRNMLIAEWIYRETGEVRVRKQVSSHIQVLDRFLRGIPEWDRLIKPSDDEETSPTEGHKFYHNSIEHMVNEHKALKGQMHEQGDFNFDNPGDGVKPAQPGSSEIINLQGLTFEMWVSQPDDWEHALHHYTRLQDLRLDPLPLEDILGWQVTFPHLSDIVDAWSGENQCEVILLNASFQLMQDFPPRHSKLGIGLELDFLDQDQQWLTMSRMDDFEEWTCTTHIYQDGHEVSDSAQEECRAAGQGKIKPFFQSRWWASTFTSLTEAKKLAEDSKAPASIELAHQHSSNFLRGLSIMQEICAVDTRQPGGRGSSRKARRRMALLLWRFSEAPPGSGGTTTWQAVWMPHSYGLTSNNSTLSSTGTGLPSLPDLGSFDHSTQFLSQTDHDVSYNMYLGSMDEELCQDGFMSFKPEDMSDSGGHLTSSFQLPSSRHGLLTSCDHLRPLSGNMDTSHGDPLIEPANMFELPQLTTGSVDAGADVSYTNHAPEDTRPTLPEHPLTRFNVQTHQVLQEQLGMSGTASPKTTRTFCTDEGTLVATARPDEDADAADAEAVDDEVELEVLLAMLMDEEPDSELELVKSS
ncbi:Conidiophore development regulator abaA [Exophiala dermatitidis]